MSEKGIRKYPAISTIWVCSVAALMAVAWSLFYIWELPKGDDLVYMSILRHADGIGTGDYSICDFPRYWARHWVFNNGRSANMLASFTMGVMPHWLVAIMCGIVTGAMYLLILVMCRLFPSRHKGAGAMLVAGIVAFLLPWWDSFSLIDVSYNYVWATSLPLLAVWMLKHSNEKNLSLTGDMHTMKSSLITMGVIVLSLIAGMMHEAATLPLCAGMLWMAYTKSASSQRMDTPWCVRFQNMRHAWHNLGPARRIMLRCFMIGTAIVTLAPGTIMRGLREKTPDDVWWLLIVKSAPITLILIAAILIAMLTTNGRRKLHELFMSDSGLWAVSALCSVVFVAIGGIVGRSGWFSQIYALIALWQWWRPQERYTISKYAATPVAIIIGCVMVAQMAGVAAYNYRGYLHEREVRALYEASPDGVVFYDLPDDMRLPLWAFSRVRYFHPEDDYTHYGFRAYYKKQHSITVLPKIVEASDLAALSDEGQIIMPGGVAITATLPEAAVMPDAPGWYGRHVGRSEYGERWIIPFNHDGRTLYYSAPCRMHWGDR